jgi:hypothetical protein
MIDVQILEPHDTIQPTDWCRPLTLVSMSGGMSDSYSFRSMYSGTPENNVKWVPVQAQLGSVWFGQTVDSFNCDGMQPYEFVRGDIPKSHQLDMRGYTDISKSVLYNSHDDDNDDDIPF